VKRAFEEGHELVVHTFTHSPFALIDAGRLEREIVQTIAEMRLALGMPDFRPKRFRPPFGLQTPAVRRVTKKLGLLETPLTFFINDVHVTPAQSGLLMEGIRGEIRRYKGAAIVLHEMRYLSATAKHRLDKSWLPKAVEDLIIWGRAEGFHFSSSPPKKGY
jgi:peptidoglycan/xylan/chitin deacetylase (PgdA/CDA1 family)